MTPDFVSPWGANRLQGRALIEQMGPIAAQITGTVVDVGAGRSPHRPLFANAAKYVRVDVYQVDDEVLVGNANEIPVGDGEADALFLGQMLGDVPDLPAAFREFHRVLAPGGRILIYESPTFPQHDLPHDYWRVLPEGLRWLATNGGFEVEKVANLGGYFTQLSIHWNHFLLAPLGRGRMLKPLLNGARGAGNAVFGLLDRTLPRNDLASDYFACLRKL